MADEIITLIQSPTPAQIVKAACLSDHYAKVFNTKQFCKDGALVNVWLSSLASEGSQHELYYATGMQALPNGDLRFADYSIGPFPGSDDEIARQVDTLIARLLHESGAEAGKPLTEAQKVAENCMRSGLEAVRMARPDSEPMVDVDEGLVITFLAASWGDREAAVSAHVHVIKDDGTLSPAFKWSHGAGAIVPEAYSDQVEGINAAVLSAWEDCMAPDADDGGPSI